LAAPSSTRLAVLSRGAAAALIRRMTSGSILVKNCFFLPFGGFRPGFTVRFWLIGQRGFAEYAACSVERGLVQTRHAGSLRCDFLRTKVRTPRIARGDPTPRAFDGTEPGFLVRHDNSPRSIVTSVNHIAVIRTEWHDALFAKQFVSFYTQRIHRSLHPPATVPPTKYQCRNVEV
jgi:hypothetical protein